MRGTDGDPTNILNFIPQKLFYVISLVILFILTYRVDEKQLIFSIIESHKVYWLKHSDVNSGYDKV